jgi:hypothetical protein
MTAKEQSTGDQFRDMVKYLISEGHLDDYIQGIAKACFDRRDAIQKRGAVPNPAPIDLPIYSDADIKAAVQQALTQQVSNLRSEVNGMAPAAEPVVPPKVPIESSTAQATKPNKKARRGGFLPYAIIGGVKYKREDIIGKVFQFEPGKPLYYEVTGIGTRALKVTMTDVKGTPVPLAYVKKYTSDSRIIDKDTGKFKEPIFLDKDRIAQWCKKYLKAVAA